MNNQFFYYCIDCQDPIDDGEMYELCNQCADNYGDDGELIEKEEVTA